MNPTVKKLILNEEDIKLAQAIRLGKEEGMVDFTESLRQLVVAEKIERAVASRTHPTPNCCGWRSRASLCPSKAFCDVDRRSQERSAMYPPVPGALDVPRFDPRRRRRVSTPPSLLPARPGADAQHDARAGDVL